MEGQFNLVGPQRPGTHDQLFASLPITRKLIFSDQRIEGSSRAVGPSIFSRPNKTTRHPESEAEPVECADENANARARRNIAIPAHLNWNEWLRWLGTPGRLKIRNATDAEDRTAVASARLVARGGTTAPRVLTIRIVKARHWLNHAVASPAERG
jgi:hypothetical protein